MSGQTKENKKLSVGQIKPWHGLIGLKVKNLLGVAVWVLQTGL